MQVAEDAGLDTLWLGESHFRPQRAVLASPLVGASAVAARTKRIRIGLAVQVLPLANPLRVAEEAAIVDHVSVGITGVSLDVNPGGQIPYDRVVHSIRLLTDKVIPKFK